MVQAGRQPAQMLLNGILGANVPLFIMSKDNGWSHGMLTAVKLVTCGSEKMSSKRQHLLSDTKTEQLL